MNRVLERDFNHAFQIFYNRFDLKDLSGKQYTVQNGDKKYVFGVCTEPKEPCNGSTGACLVTGNKTGQSSSMGIVSSDLQLSDERNEAPYLFYKSGSVCGTMNQHWTTKIEFSCQLDGMPAGPKIIEDENCKLIIHFATKLVCTNEVNIQFWPDLRQIFLYSI